MDRYIVVEHPCCGSYLGAVVESNEEEDPDFNRIAFARCMCGSTFYVPPLVPFVGVVHHTMQTWPLKWLRKLPPLTDDEDVFDTSKEVDTVIPREGVTSEC